MQITLFGFLWLTLLASSAIFNNKRFLLFLVLLSFTLQSTTILTLNESGIGPSMFSCLFFILWAIVKKTRSQSLAFSFQKNKPIYIPIIGLLMVFSFSAFLNQLSDFDSIIRLIQLFILGLTVYCCSLISVSLSDLQKILKYVVVFVLVMGIVQFAITSNFIPRIFLIKELFFNDDSPNVYFNMDNYKRMCSVFMEPSYFASFLVGVFPFFYITNFKNKNTPILLAILIETLLTFSTTAYLAMFCMCIMLFIFSKNHYSKSVMKIIFGVGVILAICNVNTLNSVLFQKLQSGSAITRRYWDLAAIKAFEQSPILGIGYKQIRGSSIFFSVLGQGGILACLCYIFMAVFFFAHFIQNRAYNLDASFSLGVLGVMICQIVACPDLDLCTFWMMLALYILAAKKEKQKALAVFNVSLSIAKQIS